MVSRSLLAGKVRCRAKPAQRPGAVADRDRQAGASTTTTTADVVAMIGGSVARSGGHERVRARLLRQQVGRQGGQLSPQRADLLGQLADASVLDLLLLLH